MTCAYSQSGNFECQFEHKFGHQYYRPVIIDGEHWCQFHAPLEDKNGNPTYKSKWSPDEIKGFYKGISELRENALAKQEKLDLSRVVFPGNAKFEGVQFPEVDFSHARFEGNADFQNAQFSGGNAHFSSVKFCGETNFSGAMFNGGEVDFRDAEFSSRATFSQVKINGGNADFQDAKFKVGAHFQRANFSHELTSFENARFCGDNDNDFTSFSSTKFQSENTNFRGTNFSKKVHFKKTQFNGGDTDFKDAKFHESVIFQNAQFNSRRTSFKKTNFIEKADFQDTKFCNGCVFFKKVKFNKNAVFSGAQFNEGADFREAEFKGKANFDTTKFNNWDTFFSNAKFIGGDADFKNAEFKWNASFENTKFRWNAIFSEAEFKKSAHFEEVIFGRDTYFRNTVFSSGIGEVNFKKAQFKGKADFKSSRNNGDLESFQCAVDFSGAEFLGEPIFEVTFENRTFQQKTSFWNCTFEKAPRFHGCSLHQDTDFTDARFWDRQGDEAVKAYRTLKLDMEAKRAREEQLTFYALEMESRQRTTKRKLLKFISWLYGIIADYGQSIISPFASAIMVFVLFMIAYSIFILATPIAKFENTDIVVLTFRFSLEQIIRPFRALENSPSLSGFIEKASPSNLWHLCLGFTTTLQSVLSFVTLGLGALAIRWRFKIG
ncbi:MAG: pentapeptide repeat-containing protein [Nitrospinae bacterium]|nr:pentapeptide repeat-containing protein [Nitrospinota bacterium]